MKNIEMTNILNEAIINELIDENINTYTNSKSRIISDFRGEKGFTAAYNGRQLLELLQNADDAKTDKVLISIDTKNNVLSIANNGMPFDSDGLRSLMLANISSKNKREFIGNKGLGFRSILNWVISVKVKTQDFILEFSPEIAKREFEKIIKSSADREKIITNEKDLAVGEIPFAILAIPDFKMNTENQDFITIVELNYKESEERSILEQLKTITPEVLLFLNHIHEIEIIGASELDKKLTLTEDPVKGTERVSVNEFTWNIFNSGEKNLPNKSESFYAYKIAWQDNLADKDTCFSTYFPTKVATHLPCLIHATFDLDPSRNQLNKSDDNDYILLQIAQSLSVIAENKLKNDVHPDWKAYQFLTVDGKSENRLLDKFFDKIESLKSDAAIYPTDEGKYKIKSEIIFYGNDFSAWVIRNNVANYFEKLLLPIPSFIKVQPDLFTRIYTKIGWQKLLANVTNHITSIDERVNLIALLLEDTIKKVLQDANLPLLLDEQQKIVHSDIEVFTLKQASIADYEIPEYVNIAFLDDTLYTKLEERFKVEIERIRNACEHKSRPLKRLISPIVNLGSNDITDVIRNISRSFAVKINDDGVDLTLEVKKFVTCLFNIFKKNPDRKGSLVDTVYLVNRNWEKTKASDLFLGQEYPTGKVTEQIFEGIYSDDEYLAGNDFWQLTSENDNIAFIEDFFLWLGVNKYTKFKNEIKDQISDWSDYPRFVFDKIGRPNNITSVNYKVKYVENFNRIIISNNFSLEKLIAWIIKDSELFNKLDNNSNNDSFESYYNKITRPISYIPSYFKFQISQSKVTENLFVDFEFAGLLGVKTVNTSHELFKKLNIGDIDILAVLSRLGVKMSFNDLEIEKVYSLLNVKQSEHAKARKIYQLAFNYFKNKSSVNYGSLTKQTNLLAVKNGIKEYHPTEDVYYSDNTTLPSKIMEDFWIFDFPKRSGEKQLAEYFGLKTFKDIAIDFKNNIETHRKIEIFNNWLNKIKPFILTYRLNSISKEKSEKITASNLKSVSTNLKTTVTSLKKVSINLVSKLEYSITGGEYKQLLPNEFINKNKQEYYICAASELSIEQLKKTPAFCEAIAEILCVLFEVNENKDDFRSVFKDDFDLKDTKYLIQTKSLNDKFEDACRLLGLSINQMEFWKAITKIKGLEWPESVSSFEDLQKIVFEELNFKLTTNYEFVDFDVFDNQQSYEFLSDIRNSLSITLSEINKYISNFPGLFHWHKERLKHSTLDVELLWNKAWWLKLSDQSESEQRLFESKRKIYNREIELIISDLAKERAFEINPRYEELIIEKLCSTLDIQIVKADLAHIIIENKYEEAINGYGIDVNELPIDIQSLLYFPNHEAIIKAELEKLDFKDQPDGNSSEEPEKLPVANLIPTSLLKGTFSPARYSSSEGNKHNGTHSEKSDRQKKKAGRRAEKLVKEKLIEMYPEGEVCWISGNSDDYRIKLDDSKGYDIRYKINKSDTVWKYLEVKSVSGNSFIISSNEVNVGILNKENYQLALVEGSDIYLVDDFFLDEERVAEFNSFTKSSFIKPLDYEVHFIFKACIASSNVNVEYRPSEVEYN